MTGELTACVNCVWASVDNVWEQEKLKADNQEGGSLTHPND